jgi:protein associated with RNAse G/E
MEDRHGLLCFVLTNCDRFEIHLRWIKYIDLDIDVNIQGELKLVRSRFVTVDTHKYRQTHKREHIYTDTNAHMQTYTETHRHRDKEAQICIDTQTHIDTYSHTNA